MTHSLRHLGTAVGVALTIALVAAAPSAQQTGFRQADQQVLPLLDRLTRDAMQFDRQIDTAMGRNPNRPVNPTPIENDVDVLVSQLTDTAAHLRDHFTRHQVVESDVQEVMIRGARIDQYMRRNQLSPIVENSWRIVRGELDQLAQAFNLSWDWSQPRMEPPAGPPYYSRWSGTFALDPSRSDDANRVAAEATRALAPADRQRVEQNLSARLDPAQTIALDRNGRTVSIASDRAPRGTFAVDGTPRTETNPNGGTSTVRAELYGDELSVTTTGNRGRDFTVTFEPLDNGNTLRVTRTLDVASLASPVRTESLYRRTSDQPDWAVYHEPTAPPSPPRGGGAGLGIVPSGTVLIGRLSTRLGSGTSHQGDRFSLAISGPGPYSGATLEGFVSRVSTGVARNELIFDFDRIRMRDGRTSEFAGVVSQVRTPDGRVIRVDREGDVHAGSSRADQAVQGGAVGATIGAIIGAIANGGKGAAVGAAIGGGLVGGTIYATGTALDLPRGTEVQVISQPVWDRR